MRRRSHAAPNRVRAAAPRALAMSAPTHLYPPAALRALVRYYFYVCMVRSGLLGSSLKAMPIWASHESGGLSTTHGARPAGMGGGGGGGGSGKRDAGLADLASAIRSLSEQQPKVQKIDFGSSFENVLGDGGSAAAPPDVDDKFERCFKWITRYAEASNTSMKQFAAKRAVAAMGSDAESELDEDILLCAGFQGYGGGTA